MVGFGSGFVCFAEVKIYLYGNDSTLLNQVESWIFMTGRLQPRGNNVKQ